MIATFSCWQLNHSYAQSYCPASGGCSGFDYVKKVTFSDMSNTSICSNTNYTGTVAAANVNIGTAVNLTLERFNPNGVNVFAAVWIDWNNNGDFEDDPLEKVGTFSGTGNYTTNVTAPAGANIGLTRMRIRIQGGTPPTSSCGTAGYEVEDYEINVKEACNTDFAITAPYSSPVRSTDGAGKDCAFSSADDHVYAITIPYNGDWTFSVCSPSTTYDTEIHLGTSCCGNSIETNNDGGGTCGTASSITRTGLAAGTYYLTIEGNGAETGDYELTVTSATVNYCTATNTDCDFEYITNFTLTDINNNSNCGAGYDDFTNLIANLTVGETYNGTAEKSDILANYNLDLWIDWDQNGAFTETERIKGTLSGTSSYSFVVSPPTTAKSGNSRIRVRMVLNDVPNACGTAGRGDIEDYTANVIAPAPNCATNNAPADAATGICSNTALSWSAPLTGSTPSGYKIYLGTSTNPGLVATKTGTTYNPGALLPNTQYFWKVVPYNTTGDATGCAEYTFTTTDLSASATPKPLTLCVDETQALDGGPTGGATPYSTHKWTGSGSAYVSDANVQDPSFTPTVAGNFTLTYTVTDANGCKASDNIAVTAESNVNPTVTIDLTSGTNPSCDGEEVMFTATPTNGGTAPTYKWMVNGIEVGTDVTYTASDLIDGDVVSCELTSNANCVTSSTATSNEITMTVNPSVTPEVTVSLTTGNNPSCEGENVSFTASETNGGTSPSFEWFVNGSSVGTGSTYGAIFNNDDVLTCVLTSNAECASPANVTSDDVVLIVNQIADPTVDISITTGSNPACEGSTIEFTPASTNEGQNPIYDWYVNGVLTETGATFLMSNFIDGDIVSCILTSDDPCASSTTANSNEITLSVTQPVTPTISTSITSGMSETCEGTEIEFTASATNEGSTPTYQWKVNGVDAGTGITFTSSTLADSDEVTCVLTSSEACTTESEVTSSPIAMIVHPITTPEIIIDLSSGNTMVCEGASALFQATLTDEGPSPTFEWFLNGSAVGTASTYTTSSLVDNDEVKCVLTSDALCRTKDTDTSNVMIIDVVPVPAKPMITKNSLELTSSSATGNQWYKDGAIMAGEVNQTLVVTENGVYTVIVTIDGCSSPESEPTTIGNVGIDELIASDLIKVTPNPSKGMFFISMPSSMADMDLNIRVYNAVGELVYSGSQSAENIQIDLTNVVTGVYVLKIDNSELLITKRLVKE